MSDTLYIQIDRNVSIQSPRVVLEDIAQLFCKNGSLLGQCRFLKVYEVPDGKAGRYVVSALDVVNRIQTEIPELEVNYIGEPVFILTYEDKREKSRIRQWLKTALICLITFFGSGFAIMTYNTDADVTTLFAKLYEAVTGEISNGFTELELMYSIGIGIGVIFFFNHFGCKKLTEDPTPMEVQMRLYEDDVDATVMEQISRSCKTKGEES